VELTAKVEEELVVKTRLKVEVEMVEMVEMVKEMA